MLKNRRNVKFIFDVDGTLTPSRQVMDEGFFCWFDDFCSDYDVYLATGSDYEKTVEQLGSYLCEKVSAVYACSGNDVWSKGERIRTSNQFTAPKELYSLMEGWIQSSQFDIRSGNHIEERTGTINFSVLGRNATLAERKAYIDYDNRNRERETIAHIINSGFSNITATVGGETGIDIYYTGFDKSQILSDFKEDDAIYFFGDRMDAKGNDYPLAMALAKGRRTATSCFAVSGWRDTWNILKGLTKCSQ